MAPRFRNDQVGSLLRPQDLIDLFPRSYDLFSDQRTPEILEAISRSIGNVVRKQLDLSIRPLVTGEYERTMFCNGMFENFRGMTVSNELRIPEDFRRGLRNVEGFRALGIPSWGNAVATGKISHERSSYLPVWEMMKKAVPEAQWGECKMSFITPTWPHVHLAKGTAYTAEAYGSDAEYFEDLAAAYRTEFRQLYDAGLRNVQIDDPVLTYFILDDFRNALERDGVDPDELLRTYIGVHNKAIEGLPADMHTGIHLCRGNMPKNMAGHETFNGSGSYERIAEPLFGGLRHNAIYLEFDDARSGGFEPLRFVREGTSVVLGLVSTKSPDLEDLQHLEGRVREAAEVIARGQGRAAGDVLRDTLAVSPQCGFATSHLARGVETEEKMWEKLVLVRDLARKIWADAQ